MIKHQLVSNKNVQTFNTKFGKIQKFGVVKYAQAGIADDQLLKDGWLPITDNKMQSDDPDYVYVIVGWHEVDGHIEKKFEKRKRISLRKKYSREKIIAAMGDNYMLFISKLKEEHPALPKELEKSTVYFDGCGALSQVEKIYDDMFNLTIEEGRHLILEPAEIKNKEKKS